MGAVSWAFRPAAVTALRQSWRVWLLGLAGAVLVITRREGLVLKEGLKAGHALAFACHLLFEPTVWPEGAAQWLGFAGLGLLPVGAAFYSWDYGVKRGDIMVLGAASYSSPLLSTQLPVATGMSPYHWSVAGACLLITAGAVLAARDMLLRRRP